jgi:hypothetical protein
MCGRPSLLHSQQSTPNITTLGTLTQVEAFTCDAYQEENIVQDEYFKEVFQWLQGQVCEEEGVGNISKDGLLYKLDKLCVLEGERLQLIREAYTSKVVRHFGVGKIVANLQA